ncbi:MAG: N(4)-(beta-N-acetylglucosaminyl)-L-asparaginase [Clostridia bacterium]|nr:N(4)-(beta-N-acetylglucosaminyl)-L-asparaginase [Clostridia bacterium]
MNAVIGTWKMSLEGIRNASGLLSAGCPAGDAVEKAIVLVEDEPSYVSVGYGGLPDRDGHVMTDAAFMDGSTLRIGGVMSVESVRNPIKLAHRLCGRQTNCLLAGDGAVQAAREFGLPMRDMRTEESMRRWREACAASSGTGKAYTGHDTVCVLALDNMGKMSAGTSTSGLFMKAPGRVGDSPLIGSGFYCDDRFGAAAATGLGEDIMRGCLSYETVSLMRRGADPTTACREALEFLVSRKRALGEDSGAISLIALAPDGSFGAATTLAVFPFTTGTDDQISLWTVGYNDPIPRKVSPDKVESD